jgi:hypothetical protein
MQNDGVVVPLFGGQDSTRTRKTGGGKDGGKTEIFFRFPKDARFEFTASGEMIISLDPAASAIVHKQWASYIRATETALISKRIVYHLQYPSRSDVPDVIRIQLTQKS